MSNIIKINGKTKQMLENIPFFVIMV